MPKPASAGRRNLRRPARQGLLAGAAVVLLGPLAACSADRSRASAVEADDGRPVVLASFTVLADMTAEVAGDRVRVESLTKPGAEVHGYEPTPSDLERASEADLVLVNGLGLEGWSGQFIDQLDAPQVSVTDEVDTVPIAEGEAEGEANPHAWMSPVQAQHYVAAIEEALSELDPGGAEEYAANAADYSARIDEVGQRLVTGLSGLPEAERALVTCEGAFSYLARDAGLAERYLWPVNSDAETTPRRVEEVVRFVEERDVPAVFCESTVSDQVQQRVVEQTGARFGGTLYVDSLSEPGGPVPTYLDLLEHDLDTVLTGLGAS